MMILDVTNDPRPISRTINLKKKHIFKTMGKAMARSNMATGHKKVNFESLMWEDSFVGCKRCKVQC